MVGGDVGGGARFQGDGNETARDFWPFVADLAANVDVSVGDGIGFGRRHGDGLKFFEFGGEGLVFFFELFEIVLD